MTRKTTADIVKELSRLRADMRPISEFAMLTMLEENEWQIARENYRVLIHRARVGHEIRARKMLGEIVGSSIVVTDELCQASHPEFTPYHYLVRVCNGQSRSRPLCPVAVAIRRVRLDLRDGKEPDMDLVGKLLKIAEVKKESPSESNGHG